MPKCASRGAGFEDALSLFAYVSVATFVFDCTSWKDFVVYSASGNGNDFEQQKVPSHTNSW